MCEKKNEFAANTTSHIHEVNEILDWFVIELKERAFKHDISKYSDEEMEGFAKVQQMIMENGSVEHSEILKVLAPVLIRHYERNRHHPEHFPNKINDMNLIDLMEMFADWLATLHNKDIDKVNDSIDVSQERFGFDGVLNKIFKNTVRDYRNGYNRG